MRVPPRDNTLPLPVPIFETVTEVHVDHKQTLGIVVRMIAPDPSAGDPHRYSVIEINRIAGTVECIGRELDLELSRRIARFGLERYHLRRKASLKR